MKKIFEILAATAMLADVGMSQPDTKKTFSEYKLPLTKKQKKQRVRNKIAKKSRKINRV